MADVPKDIMETARDIYERLFRLGAHSKGLVVRDPLGLIARALLSERERRNAQGVTWQPIETAPKDGTWIIGEYQGDIVSAYWGSNPEGWVCTYPYCDVPSPHLDISRWAPMPAAPSLSTSAGGGERG